jgi:hypothetical protein
MGKVERGTFYVPFPASLFLPALESKARQPCHWREAATDFRFHRGLVGNRRQASGERNWLRERSSSRKLLPRRNSALPRNFIEAIRHQGFALLGRGHS